MADGPSPIAVADASAPPPPAPPAVALDDTVAGDQSVAGAKAANLARCDAASLPVVAGFVLTTEGVRRGLSDMGVIGALHERWEAAGGDDTTFVVRSSSTIEDAANSSMAGQFTTVLDVRGWDEFLAAVQEVVDSSERVTTEDGERHPMAVLVQHQLVARISGVLFGVDPVTGDRDHLAVDVVAGRPDRLVGGEVTADHHVLTRRGHVVEPAGADTAELPKDLRHDLAHIAFQGLVNFRAPQDMEWAIDTDDDLWVLQTRPVTAVSPTETGPLMGPGPVAETFPDPLTPLEADLWVAPLREGIVRALRLTGAVSEDELDASPVLTTHGRWAAVDLDLLGLGDGRPSFARRFGPRALARRLSVAWRVGRTRVALPSLGRAIVAEVDDHLSAIPRLDTLETAQVVELLDRVTVELTTVSTAEVLAGMLLHGDEATSPTGTVALAALRRTRAEGLDDESIVAAEPVVLALSGPTTATRPPLPPPPEGDAPAPGERDVDRAGHEVEDLGLRDSLRIRTRWLQELAGEAAMELASRQPAAVALSVHAEETGLPVDLLARNMHVEELFSTAAGAPLPPGLAERARDLPGPPLPAAFRITGSGRLLAEQRGRRAGGGEASGGEPAGGGRVLGTTRHRVEHGTGPADGCVLVTSHLVPELAPLLPRLAGLVAETGSPLSHLAILARESGVATVVGVPDAIRRFPPGLKVVVDGLTGEVTVLEGQPDDADAEREAA